MKGLGVTYHRPVAIWLFIGLIMVLGQIWIGGVTRLTGSGLSITKWDIVTGTLPPLSDVQWESEFALYRQTPQYDLINKGMSMSDFKFIYFWEYLHRLWARLMGIVFIVPFVWFWRRGYLSSRLKKLLGGLVLLAALTASFGWIMVASGLIERPWVNAYKLSVHLLLGFSVFTYLYIIYRNYEGNAIKWNRCKVTTTLVVGIIIQIFLGGMMSGMRTGFAFPTWPLMHGEVIPNVLLDPGSWAIDSVIQYDEDVFMPALVQFLHRGLAYMIGLTGIFLSVFFLIRSRWGWQAKVVLIFCLILTTQIVVGVFTLLAFKDGVPIVLGSLHQMLGLGLLVSAVHMLVISKSGLRLAYSKKNPAFN
jgi:cytochrome c oxidase assembly protein subunit 15